MADEVSLSDEEREKLAGLRLSELIRANPDAVKEIVSEMLAEQRPARTRRQPAREREPAQDAESYEQRSTGRKRNLLEVLNDGLFL